MLGILAAFCRRQATFLLVSCLTFVALQAGIYQASHTDVITNAKLRDFALAPMHDAGTSRVPEIFHLTRVTGMHKLFQDQKSFGNDIQKVSRIQHDSNFSASFVFRNSHQSAEAQVAANLFDHASQLVAGNTRILRLSKPSAEKGWWSGDRCFGYSATIDVNGSP